MLRLLVQPISLLQFLLLLIGCAASPTQTESFDYRARAETQVDGGVRVVDTFTDGQLNFVCMQHPTSPHVSIL